MARPPKIHHFRIVEFTNPTGTKSWRVTGSKSDGTRIRKNFSRKAEAAQEVADLESELLGQPVAQKSQRTKLSTDEIAEAEAAKLAAPGRSVSKIVAHYIALEARAKEKGVSLDAALSFVEGHYRSEVRSTSILSAYEEFTRTRDTVSETTRAHYEVCLKRLLLPDPNKPVQDFTVADIERVLARYGNLNSKKTYRRAFSTFFNWAVRHHYRLDDPCKRLDKMPKETSQIAVLSLDEVKRLLRASVDYQGGIMASPVAIGLFAGLRPSEIADLKESDIRKDKILVSGGKMRRQLKRSVPISPNLAHWLEKHPFRGVADGWKYKMRRLKGATKACRWVHDIIRHTSITFQAERDRNEALTAFNNGTSKAMMDRHYRDLIGDDKVIAE
ncbi:MAG: hypothetical protein J0M04_24060, partial [Verrucomicrobia bacterium]|nr:hypothetical protein [Verrucomicrobiota bacterium]